MSQLFVKLAHNNRVSLGIGRNPLAELITSEKKLVESTKKLSIVRSGASESLRTWSEGEGPDLNDIVTKVSMLFDYLSQAEVVAADHTETYRLHFKSIRSREEHLAILKRSQDSLAAKILGQAKKVDKMKEENKDLPEATQRLAEMREEMVGLSNTVVNEETKLGDFKRSETKDALLLKLGALLELAEKTTIVAELGKLLVASIPLERTEPGAPRAYYTGTEKTDSIMSEAQRCIQEVVFSPYGAEDQQYNEEGHNQQADRHAQVDNRNDFSPRVHERETSQEPQSFYTQQQPYSREPAYNSQEQYQHRSVPQQFSPPPQHESEHEDDDQISSALQQYSGPAATYAYDDAPPRTTGRATSPTISPSGTPLYASFAKSANRDNSRSPPIVQQQTASPRLEDYQTRSSLAYAGSPDAPHDSQFADQDQHQSPHIDQHTSPRQIEQQLPTGPSSNLTSVYVDSPNSRSRDFPRSVVAESPSMNYTHESEPLPYPATPPTTSSQLEPVDDHVHEEVLPVETAPLAPKSYYAERPYVPKEGDGAYHPQLPPVAATTPLIDPTTNSFYSSPAPEPAPTSSPRIRVPLARGESALGTKHGDLYVPNAQPSNAAPFQGSGYGRNTGDSASIGSASGRVNAGAFRTQQSSAPYTFNLSDRSDSRFPTSKPQRPPAIDPNFHSGDGPTQSSSIRDSYRRESAAGPPPLAPVAVSGQVDMEDNEGPPVPSRFEVSPLHFNKRASRAYEAPSQLPNAAYGTTGGSYVHGREPAEVQQQSGNVGLAQAQIQVGDYYQPQQSQPPRNREPSGNGNRNGGGGGFAAASYVTRLD